MQGRGVSCFLNVCVGLFFGSVFWFVSVAGDSMVKASTYRSDTLNKHIDTHRGLAPNTPPAVHAQHTRHDGRDLRSSCIAAVSWNE